MLETEGKELLCLRLKTKKKKKKNSAFYFLLVSDEGNAGVFIFSPFLFLPST